MEKDSSNKYYRYINDSNGKWYFYNIQTQKSHKYITPDSLVYDPEERKTPIEVPDEYIKLPRPPKASFQEAPTPSVSKPLVPTNVVRHRSSTTKRKGPPPKLDIDDGPLKDDKVPMDEAKSGKFNRPRAESEPLPIVPDQIENTSPMVEPTPEKSSVPESQRVPESSICTDSQQSDLSEPIPSPVQKDSRKKSRSKHKHHKSDLDSDLAQSATIAAIRPDQSPTPSATQDVGPVADTPTDLVIDIPQAVAEFDETKIQKSHVIIHRDKSFIPGEDGSPPYLPPDLQQDIKQFQFEDYAKQWFREHRLERQFSRKLVSYDILIQFSSEPLQEPIIEYTDKTAAKNAIQISKWILSYTGVINATRPQQFAQRIVGMLYANPSLRDEAYFQLIKQTRGNPNKQQLMLTWDLFLVLTTVFPSTRNAEVFIQNHLVTQSRSEDEDVAAIAQFCYIRFSARNAIGKPYETNAINWIPQIVGQHLTGHQQFGASIYEQIFNQRRSLRRMPIPYIEYHMSERLIQKGAENTEGIFRLPGNLKQVDEIADATNSGRDLISAAPINDICSLFKKWFRELPVPVVPQTELGKLETANEDKAFIQFADELPRAHKLTLMFLCGFLQRLVKSESKTHMTPKNFSICFAPNIVQTPDGTDPMRMKMFSDISIELMQTLIEKWDTSPIYPMPMEYLRE